MNLTAALSPERLSKYHHWVSGDCDKGLQLYALNLAISEAYYTSLHVLEITLRNAVHNRLSASYGRRWFERIDIIVDPYQRNKVADTIGKFDNTPNEGQIVAELTFGFWTALFGKKSSSLWGQDLRVIFNAERSLQRKQIAKRLNDVRTIRNRIAHHESIIQWDVANFHNEIRELIGWLSSDALHWCDKHCRFRYVYPGHQIIVGNLVNPSLDFTKLP